jgi:hypothetical protein
MDIDTLLHNKETIETFAGELTREDIAFLIPLLDEKNDNIRYCSLLALQCRSKLSADVYPYWDLFSGKLEDANSYQRSIGIMLISENVRWDSEKKFPALFDRYMSCCHDEKFITSRQTIQSIMKWICYAPELLPQTVSALTAVNVASFRDTQKKLILMDIIGTMLAIRTVYPAEEIDVYILNALDGGILDKKSARQVQKLLAGT